MPESISKCTITSSCGVGLNIDRPAATLPLASFGNIVRATSR